ncbi:hypothetical protein EVAR_40938_1 [Eumeta japonica]|uniref:Uncharacterized protein n=1 Tax=Eumeta variegata TaxID=151549 RepID=A0A4C1X7N7_EUMVA|nr:hypothetical protein EVAR_40938_1 [Eumeta japonica]
MYVYGTTVGSSHGSRRAAPKSDEYVKVQLGVAGGGRRGVESPSIYAYATADRFCGRRSTRTTRAANEEVV